MQSKTIPKNDSEISFGNMGDIGGIDNKTFHTPNYIAKETSIESRASIRQTRANNTLQREPFASTTSDRFGLTSYRPNRTSATMHN